MPDLHLTACSPLAGFSQTLDGVAVAETTGKALVSIAVPVGGERILSRAIEKAYGMDMPEVGQSTCSKVADVWLFGMQTDQLWLFFDRNDRQDFRPVDDVAKRLGAAGYYTDQSDGWAMVSISGPNSRQALARICSLDLHENVFKKGAVARTVMEHMGTVIFRDGPDSFIVFSPRSMAKSLLHAVTTSVKNTV